MKKIITILIGLTTVLHFHCGKYLDAKSDQSLSTPSTLSDLQSILDAGSNNWSISAVNFITDEFYMPYDYWLSTVSLYKDTYIWQPINDDLLRDWTAQYKTVEYANIVLDNIDKVSGDTASYSLNKEVIRGSALFYRAFAFWGLSQLFGSSYDSADGNSKKGIPLRTSSDFNIETIQSTVEQTYAQIISDLKSAMELLPTDPTYQTRPSGYAAMAMLARVYLSMGQYGLAYEYADNALTQNSELLDYNDLSTSAAFPLELFNKESVFYASPSINISTNANISLIDTTLYDSYTSEDLRKILFFKDGSGGSHIYKGGYTGKATLFNGLAKDELYLVKAECALRLDDQNTALNTINALLVKRYKTGTFTPYTTVDKEALMRIILSERKKELVFRGIRWSDIRRLNYYDNGQISVQRILDTQVYQLDNNIDKIFEIPQTVKNLTGIE